jgi:hypothetical protein
MMMVACCSEQLNLATSVLMTSVCLFALCCAACVLPHQERCFIRRGHGFFILAGSCAEAEAVFDEKVVPFLAQQQQQQQQLAAEQQQLQGGLQQRDQEHL